MTMHAKLITVLAISTMLACSLARASRIDADEVVNLIDQGSGTASSSSTQSRAFEFSPFTGQQEQTVPGFSDPLGLGSDPSFRVFSGSVAHMDVLGDFQPDGAADEPIAVVAKDSPATGMINHILYNKKIPNKQKLVTKQMNIRHSELSKGSAQPRTTEASPLVLTSFGSISESAIPIQVHWTKCPNYSHQRYLYKRTKKLPNPVKRSLSNTLECFVL